MAGRFSRSLALAKASWAVVCADKELLWLPVLSALALLLLLGSFVLPAAALGQFGAGVEPSPAAALGAFLFYLGGYFIALFFNTALVGAALMRMNGGDPTLRDGLAIAWARVGRIFGYAVIAATVGLLLRALEERVGWVGQLVVRLMGVAWTLATFLVVPVLVTRDVGPIEAVKESAHLLRSTWGENVIGTVGLGLAFAAAYVVVIAAGGGAALLAAQSGLPMLAVAVVFAGVVTLVVLSALQATMQGVYAAALYRHATEPQRPGDPFGAEILQSAFLTKA